MTHGAEQIIERARRREKLHWSDIDGLLKAILFLENQMGREADVINGLLQKTTDQATQITTLQAQVAAAPVKDAADLAAEDAGAALLGLPAAPPATPAA